MFSKWQWVMLATVFLCATISCSSTPPTAAPDAPATISQSLIYRDNFGPRPYIPSAQTLHQLTKNQQDEFLRYLREQQYNQISSHEAVYQYLLTLLEGFGYAGQTSSAAQALANRSGDCLSLAILTTALADLAGIDIKYQLVDDLPVFNLRGNLIEKGLHIRTILYEPVVANTQHGKMRLLRKGIKIDYFPSGNERFVDNISRNEYLSMYYRNMAADALAHNDLSKAYWYTLEALELVTNDSASLNNLAIVYRRAGYTKDAEGIYQYGIQHAQNKLTLLKNYQTLLVSTDRHQEAHIIANRLMQMDDPSPHHWYQLARQAHKQKSYNDAIKYFNQAIERAPHAAQLRQELAASHFQAGELDAAKKALETALELSWKDKDRSKYEAKLAALATLQKTTTEN